MRAKWPIPRSRPKARYNKLDRAEATLTQLWSQQPDSIPVMNLLASMLYQQRELPKLKKLQQEAGRSLTELTRNRSPDERTALLALVTGDISYFVTPLLWQESTVFPECEVESLLEIAKCRQHEFVPGEVAGKKSRNQDVRVSQRLCCRSLEQRLELLFKPFLDKNIQAWCQLFRLPLFEVGHVEYKYCCYSNGAFFKAHRDDGVAYTDAAGGVKNAGRKISFVYYFGRKPQRFKGGELVLYPTDCRNDIYSIEGARIVAPDSNSFACFPSCFYHEVTKVEEKSGDIINGRFAINGHICLQEPE